MAVGLLKHREAARLKREREGDWLGEREAESERERDRVIREAVRLVKEREVNRLERERAARKREVERSERFPLCCDCSGLVPFTMPCLLRILSSHHIYPQRGTTCRPTKYLTLFLVGFSAVAVGGEQEMEVMEKRKARKECDETRASRFIRCLLFVCFQAKSSG